MSKSKIPTHLVIFNLFYLIPFTIYYLSIKNYEFLWYVAVVFFILLLILATLNKTQFDDLVLWGLSVWGLLHMAGGGLKVGEKVLYGVILIPILTEGDLVILKFDQLVHFFGFGIATLVGYELLQPFLDGKVKRNVLYFLVVCIGMGFGAFNEMVEFIAVLFFPETGVGGYINTALDLIFNFFGSVAALFIIHLKENDRIKKQTV